LAESDLGDVPLSSVNNLAARGVVEKMMKAGISPKMASNVIQVIKMVLASARLPESALRLFTMIVQRSTASTFAGLGHEDQRHQVHQDAQSDQAGGDENEQDERKWMKPEQAGNFEEQAENDERARTPQQAANSDSREFHWIGFQNFW
jgi:hypothetical protein